MDSKYKESDGWVKCQSKKRGLEYFFNTKTKESIWCTEATAATRNAKIVNLDEKPLKNGSSTPAQDRLKRLQSKLQKHKSTSEATKHMAHKVAEKLKASASSSKTTTTKATSSSTTTKKHEKQVPPKTHSAKEPNKDKSEDVSKKPQEREKAKKAEATKVPTSTPVKGETTPKKSAAPSGEAATPFRQSGTPSRESVTRSRESMAFSKESKTSMTASRESMASSRESKASSRKSMTPSRETMPASRESRTSMTPSGTSMTPSRESRTSMTPSRESMASSRESRTSAIPSKEPIASSRASTTPSSASKTPSSSSKTPSRESMAPSSQLVPPTRESVARSRESLVSFTESLAPPVEPMVIETPKSSNGVLNKFKAMQKSVAEATKKALDGASRAVVGMASSHKHVFKAKAKLEKAVLKTAAAENAINELKSSESGSFLDVTPAKRLSIPSYHKGSANSRLEKLRQSLLQQSFSHEAFQDSIMAEAETPPEVAAVPATVEDEPMDWQPCDEDPDTSTASESQTSARTVTEDATTTVTEASTVASNTGEPSKKSSANMSEYYDNVNENLLRLSAESKRGGVRDRQKWFPDHYYFVLDTNVVLQCLAFVDELSQMQLCDTKGTILYIPYVTLQELDGLKMRRGDESVKTRAIRAIKYLNEHLNSSNMKAQSAVDERKHLIKISSADDSIINCCLQVKKHVDNVILLSEDVNLRNKAVSNGIVVSTKSDLISIHPSS